MSKTQIELKLFHKEEKKSTINLIKNLGSFCGAKKSAKQKSSSSCHLKNRFFFLMSHFYLLFFHPAANMWVMSVQALATLGHRPPAHSSLLSCSPGSYPSILPELFVRGTPCLFRRNNSQGFRGKDKAPRTHPRAWVELLRETVKVASCLCQKEREQKNQQRGMENRRMDLRKGRRFPSSM